MQYEIDNQIWTKINYHYKNNVVSVKTGIQRCNEWLLKRTINNGGCKITLNTTTLTQT